MDKKLICIIIGGTIGCAIVKALTDNEAARQAAETDRLIKQTKDLFKVYNEDMRLAAESGGVRTEEEIHNIFRNFDEVSSE